MWHAARRSLGDHARAAGITRTVVVSIVGIDHMQDYPYYRSQRAHEQAVLAQLGVEGQQHDEADEPQRRARHDILDLLRGEDQALRMAMSMSMPMRPSAVLLPAKEALHRAPLRLPRAPRRSAAPCALRGEEPLLLVARLPAAQHVLERDGFVSVSVVSVPVPVVLVFEAFCKMDGRS